MGDAYSNPTDKEWEGALRPESFKQHSDILLKPDIMFSSTGSITSTEPAYRKYPTYPFYAISVTTSVANPCAGRYGDREWGNYLATV